MLRFPTRWLAVVALVLPGLGSSGTASATSCRPYLERYFVLCRSGVCEGVFRVSEIPSFGSCGRRAEVVPADAATSRVLAPLLPHSNPLANGLFELRFRLHWPRVEQDLIPALTQDLDLLHLRISDDGKTISLTSALPRDLAALLTRAYGHGWIEQISADASDEVVQSEKRKLDHVATRERWLNLSRWTAYWGSFLIVLAILLHSIHLFFLHLYRRQPLRTPLLMQAGACVACIWVPFFTRFELWPGMFLLPALATILLAEAWAWLRYKLPATSAHNGSDVA